jgi:glycosyltransferase involved in cell wall biosynthesis
VQRDLISVVMPVYNGSRYLRQAVEAVLAQTQRSCELIAVDDGSSDDSAAILAGYGERVVFLRQANCGNVGQVRNAGIAHARGEFVAFLDQDDWWEPTKLAKQIALFRADERVGLVHTATRYFDEDCGVFVQPLDAMGRPDKLVGDCYERLLLGNSICNSSVMVRRSALDAVGPCSLRVPGNTCQDYELWLRIAERFSLAFVPAPLSVFRLHSAQGHRDRRTMLSAEVGVLLDRHSEQEWKRRGAARVRLQQLYDELATAHFDAGDAPLARQWFAKALSLRATPRSAARFAVSCLPRPLACFMRSAWQAGSLSVRETFLGA